MKTENHFGAISLQGSVENYLELGLDQQDICRAISPSCFGQQNAGKFVMEGIGRVFAKISTENLEMLNGANKILQSLEPKRELIGVRSTQPKTMFSLEMLLKVQEDAKSGSDLAKTALKSLNVYLHNKTSRESLQQFGLDLNTFTASLI